MVLYLSATSDFITIRCSDTKLIVRTISTYSVLEQFILRF